MTLSIPSSVRPLERPVLVKCKRTRCERRIHVSRIFCLVCWLSLPVRLSRELEATFHRRRRDAAGKAIQACVAYLDQHGAL